MGDNKSRLAQGLMAGLSVVVGLIGLYGLYGVATAVLAYSPSYESVAESVAGNVFMAVLELAFAGFSGWCLVAAWRGWRPRTANAVRQVCTAFAWVVAMYGLAAADRLALPMVGLGQEAWKGIGNVVVLLMVAWVYHLGSRWLVGRLGLTEDRRPAARSWAEPLLVWVIALMVFSASGRVFDELLGRQSGILALAGSLVLAVVTYKVGMRLLGWRPKRRRRVPGIDALPGGLAPPDESLAPRRRGTL